MTFTNVTNDEFEAHVELVRLTEGWDEDDPDFINAVEFLRAAIYTEAEGFIECELSPDGEIAVFPSL